MSFSAWMHLTGLSKSSILKYEGAITGSLSQWAIENQLSDEVLNEITNKVRFDLVAKAIRELEVYCDRNTRGHGMYNSALNKYSEYLLSGYQSCVEKDVKEIFKSSELSITDKQALCNIRLGQGLFRERLINYWNGCAITGMKNLNFLRASHIKPWALSTSEERLDVYNGLLLTPNLDHAFDTGYNSFNNSGLIIISKFFEEAEVLGIYHSMKVKLNDQHQKYMLFHCETIFRD
jgi:putative restriction endonuclease